MDMHNSATRRARLGIRLAGLSLCLLSFGVSSVQAAPAEHGRSAGAWAWGDNGDRLGDGTTISRLVPVPVVGQTESGRLDDLIAISAGSNHTLALKRDKSVWSWGSNYYGSLGDGTNTSRPSPVPVIGLGRAVAIAAGATHSLALKPDGTLWAWGDQGVGQLGVGFFGGLFDSTTPIQVLGPGGTGHLTGVVAIAAGYLDSFATTTDGAVWGWGGNSTGQLGDGTTSPRNTPVRVSGLSRVRALSAGALHTLALRDDGTVWAWGWNGEGELGDGTTNQHASPVQVAGLRNVIAVAAGERHSLALESNGTVWAWGSNDVGQLGAPTVATCAANGAAPAACSTSPVRVEGVRRARAIAASINAASFAIDSSGVIWGWGRNDFGQLGRGTTTARATSNQVPHPVKELRGAVAVSAGYGHTVALVRSRMEEGQDRD